MNEQTINKISYNIFDTITRFPNLYNASPDEQKSLCNYLPDEKQVWYLFTGLKIINAVLNGGKNTAVRCRFSSQRCIFYPQ